ncbi:unnamed protein product [Prunus armeniaca]
MVESIRSTLILTIHHGWYVTDRFYLGGTAYWSDNHCKDYVSMLDLYESTIKLGYTEQTSRKPSFYSKWCGTATKVNNLPHVNVGDEGFVDVDLETDDDENLDGYGDAQFGEGFLDAQFGEGFADDVFDDDINRYGESVIVDEFVYVDVQVEDEDENENEEELDVKDYVYRETEFEQSDEEDERVYGRFVVNEDKEDHEKEPGEADTYEYDTDDLRSVHDFENEGNTIVRWKTKRRRALRFKQYYRYHDLRFPKFNLGLEFPTMTECKEVVRYYVNSCAKLLNFVNNEPGPTVKVKSFVGEHTCGKEEISRFATSSWLATRFDDKLKTNLNISMGDLMALDYNGMFPIAFGVVEIENRECWTWLLEIFFRDIGITYGNGWIIITDKQKGLGRAIEDLLPTAEHRYCVKHLHANFKTTGHSSLALKQRLWAAARAITVSWWEAEMEKIRDLSRKTYKWLKDRHTCSCMKSDLCGLPCCHALAAISRKQRSLMQYAIHPSNLLCKQVGRPSKSKVRGTKEIPKEGQASNSQRPRQAANRQDAPTELTRTQTVASQTPHSNPMRRAKLRFYAWYYLMLVNMDKACRDRGTSTAGMEGRGTAPNAGLGGRGIAPTIGMGGRSSVPTVQVDGTNRRPSATFVFASGTQDESMVIS